MLSWWFGVGVLAVAAPISSAFAVRQTEFERECLQLLCPETAFDNGVKNLVNEDSLSTEQCVDCQQCTANGYSVCLGVRPTRASRVDVNNPCSCSHSVPTNCHNRLHEKVHPANITMKEYTVCYLSALQAPPRPMAANEKDSVIFTIEAFWLEPYWRQLDLENLTFHYDFAVESPESCEGTVTSSEDGVHLCNNAISLNMTIPGEHDDDRDDEYEHSENYDQYDDDLPEEVEIDKEIFGDATEVQVYYIVDVNRPRQLQSKDKSGEIMRDIKTSVESEILRFDLTAETSTPSVLPTPTETKEEDEDVSSEKGGTDFFEEEKQRENKEEKDDEKDEDADDQDDSEKKVTESTDDKGDDKADDTTKAEEDEKADDEKDEENKDVKDDEETAQDTADDDEQDDEKGDDERKDEKEVDAREPSKDEHSNEGDEKEGESDDNVENSKEEGKNDGKEDDHEDEGEDEHEDKHEEESEDQHEDKHEDEHEDEREDKHKDEHEDGPEEERKDEHEDKHEDEHEDDEKLDKTEGDDNDDDNKDEEQEGEDSAHPAEMKHRDDDIPDKYDDENEEGDDDGQNEEEGSHERDNEDEEEEEDEKDMTFMQRVMSNKGLLARWVFGITVFVCLVLVGGVCAYRKRCCCQKEKTSNGNKYSSVTGQQRHLPPEKERLNQ